MRAVRQLPAVTLLALAAAISASGQLTPPAARQAPTTIQIHGKTLVDPYPWLEKVSDPEVIAYLEAENQYSRAVMEGTEALQRRLVEEMAPRTGEADPQPPRFVGKDAYYVRSAAASPSVRSAWSRHSNATSSRSARRRPPRRTS